MALISNGSTIFDNGSVTAGLGGSMNLIRTLTGSNSDWLQFTHGGGGVDLQTYKEYVFIFNQIHGGSDNVNFTFNARYQGDSSFDVPTTGGGHRSYSSEGGASGMGFANAGLHNSGNSFLLSEGTQRNGNDESLSGFMHIYEPHKATQFKPFKGQTMCQKGSTIAIDYYFSGYHAHANSIDGYRFKFSSGAISTGTISLYGIS